jgi:uncharacterized protein
MSALRQSLKRPQFWLATLLLAALAVLLDGCRSPADQLAARVYVGLVHGYQSVVRPRLAGHVQCRFRPSCSEYSVEAVQTHGIWRGLTLTAARVRHCTNEVPPGTNDPVPETSAEAE